MPDRAGTESDVRDVTNAELMRAVVLLRGDVRNVDDKIAKLPTMETINHLKERIADLEDWQKWAQRLGLAGLAGIILNLANTFGGVVAK